MSIKPVTPSQFTQSFSIMSTIVMNFICLTRILFLLFVKCPRKIANSTYFVLFSLNTYFTKFLYSFAYHVCLIYL